MNAEFYRKKLEESLAKKKISVKKIKRALAELKELNKTAKST